MIRKVFREVKEFTLDVVDGTIKWPAGAAGGKAGGTAAGAAGAAKLAAEAKLATDLATAGVTLAGGGGAVTSTGLPVGVSAAQLAGVIGGQAPTWAVVVGAVNPAVLVVAGGIFGGAAATYAIRKLNSRSSQGEAKPARSDS